MGEDQYNKVNGRAAEAMFKGERPATIVDLDNQGGTPNQKGEKIANRVWYDGLIVPNEARLAQAVKAAIDFLKGQLITGHMCIRNADEILTDSHWPIWGRGMLSLRLRAWKLRDRGGDFAALDQLAGQWVTHHFSLLKLLMVPKDATGTMLDPRGRAITVAGAVIGPCARKSAGVAGDQVRNVCAQLAILGRVISPTGAQFWTKIDQSTLAARFTAEIIAPGGPGFGELSTLPPLLRMPLSITRSQAGHAAEFTKGLPYPKSAARGWVRYDTGEYSFAEPPPADILAGGTVTQIRGAAA